PALPNLARRYQPSTTLRRNLGIIPQPLVTILVLIHSKFLTVIFSKSYRQTAVSHRLLAQRCVFLLVGNVVLKRRIAEWTNSQISTNLTAELKEFLKETPNCHSRKAAGHRSSQPNQHLRCLRLAVSHGHPPVLF